MGKGMLHSILLMNMHGEYYIFSFQFHQPIAWSHIVELYHCATSGKEAPGLTRVPKLKYEHIYLTSFAKMRVDLAAQVCCMHVAP